MKRYFFEPGAIECHRRSGVLARAKRGLNAVKSLLYVALGGHPSDSIGQFLMLAAMVAAVAACLGALTGYVQFELGTGGMR